MRRSLATRIGVSLAACVLALTAQQARAAEESAWVADLQHMLQQIHYRHPNPEHFGPRWSEFVAQTRALQARIDELPDWQKPWELSRLVAQLSDGHTWVAHESFGAASAQAPLRLQSFDDGVFVTAVPAEDDALRDLVGARVTRIGSLGVDEIRERAHALRLTSADNSQSLAWWTDQHLRLPSALAMLGALEAPGPVRYAMITRAGEERVITVDAVEAGQQRGGSWRGLVRTDGSRTEHSSSRDERLYSTEVHAEHGALVLRYNSFNEDPQQPWDEFCEQTFANFRELGLSRLVLDLRGNGGGQPRFSQALLKQIVREPALEERGALIVLIGRATDSAAVSFCALLERSADPVFVGTPTFLRPNGHSDAMEFRLPRTDVALRVSTLYWRMSDPSDRRPWVAPHVPVPVRFADIEAGVDVALELALTGPSPVAPSAFEPKLRRGRAGEDLRAALSEWRSHVANRWADVENEINALGYALLGQGRIDDALEVFAHNITLHPYASNVYDSYGEALLAAGDEQRSLDMYREAVRRDHRNPAAVERILELEERLAARD